MSNALYQQRDEKYEKESKEKARYKNSWLQKSRKYLTGLVDTT